MPGPHRRRAGGPGPDPAKGPLVIDIPSAAQAAFLLVTGAANAVRHALGTVLATVHRRGGGR